MTAGRDTSSPRETRAPLTVRRATLSDAGSILEISNETGIETGDREFDLYLGELLNSAENEVFVAVADGTVAGWAHVFIARRVGMAGFAEIGGMATRKVFRRNGVGRMLVAQCDKWAKRNHKSRLRVRCNAVREGAHEFYATIGFARLKDQVVYEKSP